MILYTFDLFYILLILLQDVTVQQIVYIPLTVMRKQFQSALARSVKQSVWMWMRGNAIEKENSIINKTVTCHKILLNRSQTCDVRASALNTLAQQMHVSWIRCNRKGILHNIYIFLFCIEVHVSFLHPPLSVSIYHMAHGALFRECISHIFARVHKSYFHRSLPAGLVAAFGSKLFTNGCV